MGIPNWTSEFTKRIRPFNHAAWGALAFGGNIPLGAFGVLNHSGEFQYYGIVDTDAETQTSDAGEWVMTDSQTSTNEQNLAISGEFIDPDTGTEVKAGLEWAWTFGKGTNFLIRMPQTMAIGYADVATMMQGVAPQLVSEAHQYGYLNGNGTLKKGFLVVVQVIQIYSGLVAGSYEENSSFMVNGSINAINRLMSGAIGAAYSVAGSKGRSNAFSFLWPQTPLLSAPNQDNVASMANPRTIAFVAASYDGTKLIPAYTG